SGPTRIRVRAVGASGDGSQSKPPAERCGSPKNGADWQARNVSIPDSCSGPAHRACRARPMLDLPALLGPLSTTVRPGTAGTRAGSAGDGEGGERLVGEPEDGPLVHRDGTGRPVELDRRGV